VASPLVKRVVRRRFFSARDTTTEDQEDVCGDAIAAIISRVKGLRSASDTVAIADFESYAAGVASHMANRFFMARSPQRTRLRSRLRYVLTTDARFRIWQSDHGTWHCGMAGKTGMAVVLSDADVEACRGQLAATELPAGRLPELVHKILTVARGGMELSGLTSLAADSLGITDRRATVEDLAETLFTLEAGAEHQAEMRDSVRALWREVCELPLPQRRALLLNLGSSGGSGQRAGAWLIPDLGIAPFRVLAEKLGMTPEDLASIWNRLPLPDNEIGGRFGLERQQVINLRSAARQRLARRLPI
jgi:hypothetical protein